MVERQREDIAKAKMPGKRVTRGQGKRTVYPFADGHPDLAVIAVLLHGSAASG